MAPKCLRVAARNKLDPNRRISGPCPRSYSFTTPDGVVLTVNWVADENGFQATGDHLPTPPPMPEHVVKMLADLKAAGVL
jgi:hypothetical protein